MSDAELLNAVCEIRDLVRLIAEPQIAARDQKLRDALRGVVGRSVPKQHSIFLMDGARMQGQIRSETGINKGHLSTLVKQLSEAELLISDVKYPKLAISVPKNFFENNDHGG
jgi:hypothetical protein